MAKPETIAAIKAKFPKVNLSKKRLEQIGDKLEAKVTDENTLDAAIDTFNEYNPVEDIAKADDKLRTAEEKLKLARNPPKEEESTDEPVVDDNVPAWAKQMMDQNKRLSESLSAMQVERTQGTIRQKATEQLKDIPASYWNKRAIPDKEDAIEAFVTEVKSDYGVFKKEMTEQGISIMPRPTQGRDQQPGSKDISPAIKQAMDAKKAAAPVQQLAPQQGNGNKFIINTPTPL